MAEVIIKSELIPDEVWDAGCSVLARSVRRYFELPGVREDYERWLREEGKDV